MTTPGSPDDPFAGFDWSKQEAENNPDSGTPLLPPQPPAYVPQPLNSAPAPGTYYNNVGGQIPNFQKSRGGTLTAFMVLSWITFGFSLLGICGGLITSVALLETGNAFQAILGLITIIAIAVFSFLAALYIILYKKSGVNFGWILIGLLCLYLASNLIFSVINYLDNQGIESAPGAFSSGTSFTFLILTLIINILFTGGWILAKVILLTRKSTKEHLDMFFV